MTGQVDTYRKEIFNFLRTVTIKFEPFAYSMGQSYMDTYGISDPNGKWNPYYIHLAGEYTADELKNNPMTVWAIENDKLEKVIFSKAKTPMGIYLECKDYAKVNGIIHRKTVKYKNELGETVESDNGFDYYEQNDPKQYRIIFVDHISLIQTQQGMDLRQSMNKLSEFFVELRNDYKYTPIIVHQQAMFESLDAFKMDKLEPSIQNLADSKAIARDLDMCLGIFSPYKYNLHEYKGYNINMFKDNIRFVSVLLNRNGLCNGMLPLYFDGAVNYFAPLCNPKDETGLQKIYNYLDKIRNKPNKVFMFFNKLFNKYMT